jgi:hypothetical protein
MLIKFSVSMTRLNLSENAQNIITSGIAQISIGVITLADLQTVVTIVVQLSIAGATIYKLLKSKK